jgi:hypothetical protein
MTPEELNRTMEFIVQHQAHLAASLDREQETRERDERKFEATQSRLAALQLRLTELIEHQSGRLDRHDSMMVEMDQRFRESQRESDRRHQELLSQLRDIFERLTRKG